MASVRTDAPYVAEAAAVVDAREALERVSGGRVLEATLLYLLDDECCDEGPHRLLDLDSPATVKLIGDAYNKGSPCGMVEVVHFLQKRDTYVAFDVEV